MDESLYNARRTVLSRLQTLQQAGVMQLPKRAATARPRRAASAVAEQLTASEEGASTDANGPANSATKAAANEPAAPSAGRHAAGSPSRFESAESRPGDPAAEFTLDVLQQHVAGCTRCEELARTRTQTVFGRGSPNARLCFLGEAPGADEDRLGEPFVGRAGQLLTKIIEACTLKREDVYILNMIKCRPPGNRNPLPTELANCREYLDRQLDLIRPEFICCLGAVAAQNLLNTTLTIGKLRGKWHEYRGVKVICTYHPAFLLRSPSFKKETWADMKMLMKEMGVELE